MRRATSARTCVTCVEVLFGDKLWMVTEGYERAGWKSVCAWRLVLVIYTQRFWLDYINTLSKLCFRSLSQKHTHLWKHRIHPRRTKPQKLTQTSLVSDRIRKSIRSDNTMLKYYVPSMLEALGHCLVVCLCCCLQQCPDEHLRPDKLKVPEILPQLLFLQNNVLGMAADGYHVINKG